MKDLYGYRDVDTRPLSGALKQYTGWLKEIRAEHSRRRSLPPDYPDLVLQEKLKGEPGLWLNNRKLEDFLYKVVFEGAVFDFNQLKLLEK